jgi:hypothetical protein
MFWCLGMYSSASTWTFNVVQQIAKSVAATGDVMPVFVGDAIPDCDETQKTLVIKTHATEYEQVLAKRAQAIIITIRDPRDAVASLMKHNKAPFDIALRATEASAWTCARFATLEKSSVFRFEDRFFDDPKTVERIAGLFPGTLAGDDSRRIFTQFRRDAVEEFIADMERLPTTFSQFNDVTGQWDVADAATGWHKHHAGRSAEIGRWRRDLSDLQALTVQQRMWPWMERFGYRPITPRHSPYTLEVGRYGLVA